MPFGYEVYKRIKSTTEKKKFPWRQSQVQTALLVKFSEYSRKEILPISFSTGPKMKAQVK